ncbi:MAG: hypothetical protein O7A04_02105 [Acidobacteria bacterium]|nr:hypothetical protein [Acidobacteriota bacterium]
MLERLSWRLANALDDRPDIDEALEEIISAYEEENRRKTAARLKTVVSRINW